MKKLLGELTFKLSGWSYEVNQSVLEKKQVIIGFEHTSMMDAVLSLAIFQIHDLKIHTLIKKELFKGPLKPFLEKIGGIPVDRKSNKDVVSQMVDLFQSNDEFNLVIAPEATRAERGQARKPIRTGFWHIGKSSWCSYCFDVCKLKNKTRWNLWKDLPNRSRSRLSRN